jgi:hypothetical protein
MTIYISSENNNIFLHQRKYILKKFVSDDYGSKKIFLFTEDFGSLKKLDLKIKRYKFKTLYIVDKVINSDHYKKYLNKSRLYFNYLFFLKKITLYTKLVLYFKNFRSLLINIKLVYIFVGKKDKKLSITGNKNFIIFFSKPFIHVNKNKITSLDKNKIKIKKNYNFYFDSAFPLHPDLIGIGKKLKFNNFNKRFVLEYLNYIDRVFNDKKKVIVFLPPRTFESIKKNVKFKNFILKFNPKKYFFMKGIDSYLSLNNKTNKVFSQKGGQINFFKEKKIFNIKTIKLDKKFIKILNGFKNKNLVKENKDYINNFESIFFEVF